MQPLQYIFTAMAVIVAFWIGYFVGNFVPIKGKNKKGGNLSNSPIINIIKNLSKEEELENESEDESIKESEDDKEQGDDPDADPPQPAEIKTDLEPIPKSPVVELKNATQLWHDRRSKKIYAEIEGEVIDLDSSLTEEQKNKLGILLIDLQDRVGVAANIQSAIAERLEGVMDEFAETKTPEPTFNPIKSFINYVQSDVSKLEEKTDSIPTQINEILQTQIKGTKLAESGIQVSEWAGRGVVFMVGLEIYEDIEEIPDASIRKAINKAVKAWEKSQIEE